MEAQFVQVDSTETQADTHFDWTWNEYIGRRAMGRGIGLLVCFTPMFMVAFGTLAQETDVRVPDADEKVLDTLTQSHPRLILTDERLDTLKRLAATDVLLARYVKDVLAQADEAEKKPPLEHRLIGPRLLDVSRECLARVYALGLAWRWTGDARYAKAAESNLLTVADFPDWNPSHFLDTAEMSHAVGVGYDWLFASLSDPVKMRIKTALIEKGLMPGIAVYIEGKKWTKSEFNWNQVCNGGMMVGALAIADTDPRFAAYIIPQAVTSLPLALAAYDPDGAWMEGPAYWGYATRYTAYGLCALDTALGHDFGLSDRPGLRVTGHFPNYTTGPTGLYLNYADSGERGRRRPMSCMFWLARKYHDMAILDAEHAALANGKADAGHVIWYAPPSEDVKHSRELDRWFRSPVDIVVMRSAWDEPDALFVGVKGGYNQVNHGHLDLGNFEMDALGVRWARDLGSDNYNIPGYWDKKKGGERWKIYRLATASHNVPMINERDQDADAVAKVVDFKSSPDEARVILDLSSAYAPDATRVRREVALIDERRAVEVRDHFELAAPGDVLWGMTTDASVSILADGSAYLTLEGKRVDCRIVEPQGASFSVEPAPSPAGQKANKGVSRLLVKLKGQQGTIDVVVQMKPKWSSYRTGR